MRIAPLAFMGATDQQIEEVSAITHAHEISKKACALFVHMLRGALDDGPYGISEAFEEHMPDDERLGFLANIVTWPREDVHSTYFIAFELGSSQPKITKRRFPGET